MKNVVIGFFLLAFIATGNSQIVLDEAKVNFTKASMQLDPATQTLVIQIPEKEVGEFGKNPLVFMKNNFDVESFIKDNSDQDYSEFQVNFVSNKGHLTARFNKDGDLISSQQKFKNMRLPHDVQLEIAHLYNNATVLRTRSFAHSKGWIIDKEYYKIKLDDGERTRRVRIDRKNDRLYIAGL
ncbi:hypothetical protein [Salinimicrobium terrae]|uniref:hypothetical protein n=1 Tax=Salinimicrobium terrae TaxID=470866 RepID=UPI00042659A0|nr:hypothetical protein [Salinimicrobium terrae]